MSSGNVGCFLGLVRTRCLKHSPHLSRMCDGDRETLY
jgi:hypothetical protein